MSAVTQAVNPMRVFCQLWNFPKCRNAGVSPRQLCRYKAALDDVRLVASADPLCRSLLQASGNLPPVPLFSTVS